MGTVTHGFIDNDSWIQLLMDTVIHGYNDSHEYGDSRVQLLMDTVPYWDSDYRCRLMYTLIRVYSDSKYIYSWVQLPMDTVPYGCSVLPPLDTGQSNTVNQ